DSILRSPDRFHKNFSVIAALGANRFSANGDEWRWRRDLTQPAYARAGASRNRTAVAKAYWDALVGCESVSPPMVQRTLLTASTTIFFQAFDCSIPVDRLLTFFDRARQALKRLQYHSWVTPDEAEASALRQEAKLLLEDFDREVASSPPFLALVLKLQA